MSGIKELLSMQMEQEQERVEMFVGDIFKPLTLSDFGLEEAEEEVVKVEQPVREPSMPEVKEYVRTHDHENYI